jgi:hypothetical protein
MAATPRGHAGAYAGSGHAGNLSVAGSICAGRKDCKFDH